MAPGERSMPDKARHPNGRRAPLASGSAARSSGHLFSAVLLFACLAGPAAAQTPEIRGVTVYDPTQVSAWLRQESGEPQADPATALQTLYRQDGYFLAETRWAPASSGRVIEVDEGRLTDISISGVSERDAALIRRFLHPLLEDSPLRLEAAERHILLASDRAGMDLSASFQPSTTGSGTALVIGARRLRQAGFASVDNAPVGSGDAYRATLQQEIYGAGFSGDLLRFTGLVQTDGDGDEGLYGQLFYRHPLGASGLYLEAFAGDAVFQRRYQDRRLDFDQHGSQVGAALGYPLRRTAGRQDYLVTEFEALAGRTDGAAYTFDSRVEALRTYWILGRNLDGRTAIEASLSASVGRRRTEGGDAALDGDRTWSHARGEIGIVTPIGAATWLRTEIEAQMAFTALPAIEQFYLGHLPGVRGYSQGEIAADSGFAVSLEVEHALGPGADRDLRVFGFMDAGSVRRRGAHPAYVTDQGLASIGLGGQMHMGHGTSLRAWIALPLVDGPSTDRGDASIYVRLTRSWAQ